ncbi:uncharacterized protein PG998_012847 [Apiospora kogelbergensis]|uniref:uncharacterized protein n=1 Tax=Apiospora kogelbergensis TaxID=1337665 RepID=UPI00312D12F4
MFGLWSRTTGSTTGEPPSAVVSDSGTVIISPKAPLVSIPLDESHTSPENSQSCSADSCSPIGPLTVTSSSSGYVGGGEKLTPPVVTAIYQGSGGTHHFEMHHVEFHNKPNGFIIQQDIANAYKPISEGSAGTKKSSDTAKNKEKTQPDEMLQWVAAIAPIVAAMPAAASNVRAYF